MTQPARQLQKETNSNKHSQRSKRSRERIEMSPSYCRHLFQTKPDYLERCKLQARHIADADSSDPFIYGRVMAHFKQGIAYAGTISTIRDPFIDSEGYNVSWQRETRTYILDRQTRTYHVLVPINREVPTS